MSLKIQMFHFKNNINLINSNNSDKFKIVKKILD